MRFLIRVLAASCLLSCTTIAADKPNIVLIMADDMGYTDIGCYGSEINTPVLRSRVSLAHRAAAKKVDPENELLWRQTMRRLEAEPLRDTVLSVAGILSDSMHGSGQAVARQKDGEVIAKPDSQGPNRRSIYVKILRLNPQTMLEVFDQPTISVNCTKRSTSTVSTQALTLLNSEAMTKAASAFADRILAEQPDDPIGRSVLIAWTRQPEAEERALLTEFLAGLTAEYLAEKPEADRPKPDVKAACRQQALADLCHMLMSSNEFVYVD